MVHKYPLQNRKNYSKCCQKNFDKMLLNSEDKRLSTAIAMLGVALGKKTKKEMVKTPHPADSNTL